MYKRLFPHPGTLDHNAMDNYIYKYGRSSAVSCSHPFLHCLSTLYRHRRSSLMPTIRPFSLGLCSYSSRASSPDNSSSAGTANLAGITHEDAVITMPTPTPSTPYLITDSNATTSLVQQLLLESLMKTQITVITMPTPTPS